VSKHTSSFKVALIYQRFRYSPENINSLPFSYNPNGLVICPRGWCAGASEDLLLCAAPFFSTAILIGSVYRAPSLKSEENKEFLRALNLAASKMHEYDGLILMGDFNLDVNWASDTPIARKAPAAEFLSEFSEIGLTHLIKGPTRTTDSTEKTLDLLLTDVPGIFTGTEVVAGVSDHDALIAYLALNVVRPTRPPKTVFNFNRVNWDQLNLDFAQHMPQEFPEMNTNAAWEHWKSIFFYCLQKNVPTKSLKGKIPPMDR
jgi:hypothetical protein